MVMSPGAPPITLDANMLIILWLIKAFSYSVASELMTMFPCPLTILFFPFIELPTPATRLLYPFNSFPRPKAAFPLPKYKISCTIYIILKTHSLVILAYNFIVLAIVNDIVQTNNFISGNDRGFGEKEANSNKKEEFFHFYDYLN